MSPSEDKQIFINVSPAGLLDAYKTLFSDDAISFLIELVCVFDHRCDKVRTISSV